MASDESAGDIEHEIETIADMWGQVYVSFNPDSVAEVWTLSNTTDEGLPIGVDEKTVRANSLPEAIEKAKRGEYDEW